MPHHKITRAALTAALFVTAAAAHAVPISLSASLTGDARLSATYQDLLINVTITGDTTSNVVNWTVDIASPNHPNAKLDEFYFSMVAPASNYSFSGFNPSGWAIETPADVQGGGNFSPTFMFQALDPQGPPNAADVTNTQDLTFTMTKASGNFTVADFLNGATLCSTDTQVGCGQLGAHLQSLQQGESGFVIGDYRDNNQTTLVVAEPHGLALAGLALLAAGVGRRRSRLG